jgi:hypothetical protein
MAELRGVIVNAESGSHPHGLFLYKMPLERVRPRPCPR